MKYFVTTTLIILLVFSFVKNEIDSINLRLNNLMLGSAVLTTDSSDTLETFRTNVNSSLTSLQEFASSTSLTGLLASTSPFGNVGIEQGTETRTVWVANTGSSTPSFAILGVNGNGRIGIASSTPFTQLGIGTANATSSISGGKFCFFFQDEAGRGMWIKLAISGSQVFSTSTTACN